MGLLRSYEEIEEAREAKETTEKNRIAAQDRLNARKAQLIEELSGYGTVMQQKKYDSESVRYMELGYDRVYLKEEYDSYWATTEKESYVSGYSGTISSSGNVNLSPDYTSYDRQVIKREKKDCSDLFYVKVVKNEDYGYVKQREDEFFENGGYQYLKTDSEALRDIKNGAVFLPKKVWKLRLGASIYYILYFLLFALIANICIFPDEIFSRLGFVAPVYYGIVSIVIGIAGLIAFIVLTALLFYNRAKMNWKYQAYDKGTKIFSICLVIFFVIELIVLLATVTNPEFAEAANSTKKQAYIFEWILQFLTIIISLIYLIICACRRDKTRYFGVEEVNANKIIQLDKIAEEINAYTIPIKINITNG